MNIPAPIDISSIDTTSPIGRIATAIFIVGCLLCVIAQFIQDSKEDKGEGENKNTNSIAGNVAIFMLIIVMLGSGITAIWSYISDSSDKDRAVNQLIEETTGLTFVNEGDTPNGSSIPFTDKDGTTVRYFVTTDNDRVFFDTP